MTVARDPKIWIIPVIAGLLSGGGGTAGINYFMSRDPVLEYRVSQCEARSQSLVREIGALRVMIGNLPPPDWREKINTIESDVRDIRDAMIRLERHGHPELKYERD